MTQTPLKAEQMPQTPATALERWKNPLTGEVIGLEVRGESLYRFQGGQWFLAQGHQRQMAEISAQVQQLQQQPLTLTDLWLLRQQWQAEMGGTGSAAALKDRWQKEGLSEQLWDKVEQMHPLEPAHDSKMAEGYTSVTTVEEVEKGLGLSPATEQRLRSQLYGTAVGQEAVNGSPPPDATALLWAERPELERAGFAPMFPRRADGRLWLPPSEEPRRGEWEKLIRPVLRPVPVAGTPQPWDSKLGGVPYRPLGAAWPHSEDGRPLRFLAQINAAQANAAGHLPDFPRRGLLHFFLSDGEVSAAVYWPEILQDAARLTREVPGFGDDWSEEFNPPERRLAFLPDEEFPSAIDTVAPTMLAEAFDPHPAGHRIGGWPMVINDMSHPGETLLFQFDGDDPSNVIFGEDGTHLGGWLGFFLPTEDLKARRFDRVRLVMDAF